MNILKCGGGGSRISQRVHQPHGVFTLPDTDADTDTDAIGFQTHCVGASVGKGKICVGVGQCEHTIMLVIVFSLKTMESLQNRVVNHFPVTLLLATRTV